MTEDKEEAEIPDKERRKKQEREEKKVIKEKRENEYFFFFSISVLPFQRWNDTVHVCQIL